MPPVNATETPPALTQKFLSYPDHVALEQDMTRAIRAALEEDVGTGDLTAQLIAPETAGKAQVIAREAATLSGCDWFNRSIAAVSGDVSIQWAATDGDRVSAGQTLCTLNGPAQALLTGERTALNFLQLLSGVATRTAGFVAAVAGTRAQIVDTRKTLPGLRRAQKYAVWCGGGGNHRMGLHDAILIKENHILAAGSIGAVLQNAQAIAASSQGRCQFIQIEVENLDELDQALRAGATMILLDNFSLDEMRTAVHRAQGVATLEASGGVNLATARAIAETGVDRISIGTLTKDVTALDLSMRFTNR